MERARPPWRRVAGAALALGAPSAAALLVFAANAAIAPAAALAVWLAGVAGAGLLAWRSERRRIEAARFLDRLAEGDDAAQLEGTGAGDDLTLAAARVKRRLGELAGRAAGLEATLPDVLDALPGAVLTIDARRRVTRANHAARELAGREALGLDLAEALRDPGVLEAADAALAGAGPRDVEFRLAGPVARDFIVRVARLARPAADGSIATLALRDVTEMRRVEQMRADFVANASHEIRTPLATLAGCVETLQGPARDDAEARERFLAIMEQQAARMTRLVSDLLSLSRIELNEHTAPTGRVRLPELLGRVIDALQPKAEKAGVTVELTAGSALPPAAGDEDELWQVFQNLVDNAIKYGAEGKLVEVRCELVERNAGRSPALRVAIRDRGPGVPREHLPRLTERFYRVDTARSRELGGTGLGLAIVKHIVNRHRGALTIDSEPGRGSVFAVQLPAAGAS